MRWTARQYLFQLLLLFTTNFLRSHDQNYLLVELPAGKKHIDYLLQITDHHFTSLSAPKAPNHKISQSEESHNHPNTNHKSPLTNYTFLRSAHLATDYRSPITGY